MRLSDLIEMAPPSGSVRNLTFYHGTSSEEAARNIRRHGIVPQSSQQSRAQLAPVAGRVYVTPSLKYAIIYAIGGNFLGHEAPKQWTKGGRYGYVFAINGEDIVEDVQPDEDNIGEAVMFVHDILERNKQAERYYGGSDLYRFFDEDRSFAMHFYDFARHCMTERQFSQSIHGEVAYQAAGGKRCLRKMPDWMKLKLIQGGSHVSYAGSIKPSQCWRILKSDSKKLIPDGSNFFDIAKPVT